MVKFLVIRLSSIGDIVLTTPVVRCLKQQVAGAEVHFLTKRQNAGILQANPYIDKLHYFDDDLKALTDSLSTESFDYIIDLHKNIRSNMIRDRLKLFSFSFPKLTYQKWLLVNFKIDKLPRIHIVDRYFEAVRLFDVVNDGKGLDYFVPPEDETDISVLPEEFRNGFIAFAIGAKHFTKKLPPAKIISICKAINFPIVLLGDRNDSTIGEQVAAEAGHKIFNACGKFSLNGSASLLHQSRLAITHDTGLMHIAAAFKKNIISVWGNTVPAFGMYPYLPGEYSEIVEVTGLKCRPCTRIGFSKCPKKHFRCMNDIDENKIVNLARLLFTRY
ncbi:MAG: glycosyltransferase family 9 protein [Bacteroidia bacterium]|nr:glycosyltransferase family 9 protein [Bacteroidia bacterium]